LGNVLGAANVRVFTYQRYVGSLLKDAVFKGYFWKQGNNCQIYPPLKRRCGKEVGEIKENSTLCATRQKG
jgi:hypothetical protein